MMRAEAPVRPCRLFYGHFALLDASHRAQTYRILSRRLQTAMSQSGERVEKVLLARLISIVLTSIVSTVTSKHVNKYASLMENERWGEREGERKREAPRKNVLAFV